MKTHIVNVLLCAALCCVAASPTIAAPADAEQAESETAASADEAAARKVAFDALVARMIDIALWPVPEGAIAYTATVGGRQCAVRVAADPLSGEGRWEVKALDCKSESQTAARLGEAAARKAALDAVATETIHIALWGVAEDVIAYTATVGDRKCSVIVAVDPLSDARRWEVGQLECKP